MRHAPRNGLSKLQYFGHWCDYLIFATRSIKRSYCARTWRLTQYSRVRYRLGIEFMFPASFLSIAYSSIVKSIQYVYYTCIIYIFSTRLIIICSAANDKHQLIIVLPLTLLLIATDYTQQWLLWRTRYALHGATSECVLPKHAVQPYVLLVSFNVLNSHVLDNDTCLALLPYTCIDRYTL